MLAGKRSAATVFWGLFVSLPLAYAAPDVDEIVRKAFEKDESNERKARQYTFHRRIQENSLNKNDAVKKTESKTHDVTLLDGAEYERLIAIDDTPLDTKREAKEQRKLEKSIEKRQNESPKEKQRRLAKIEKEREKERRWIREMQNIFECSLAGEETIDGVETWVIAAEPKPNYEPEYRKAKFLQKMRGKFWIAKSDYGWVKAAAETTGTVSYGLFLLRLAKGSTLSFHQRKLEEGVWMIDEFRVRFQARAGLIKKFKKEVLGSFSNYRKFTAEAALILPAEPQAIEN